ncbi:Calcium-binding protein CP1 [Bienertia sinuspersici]
MCPTGTSLRPVNITGNPKSEFRGAFEVIDVDHDGKISGEDLRSFYASFFGNDEDEMIRAMIAVADANKDGYVQYDEFEKVLKEKKEGKGKENIYADDDNNDSEMMEEVFKVMDKDGDGRLGVDDLKSYLNWAGIKVNDDEVNAMIMLGCNEGDVKDGVSFYGFIDILKHLES